MADNKKTVQLDVQVGTTGADSINALGKNLTDLAADGKALPPAFADAAAALEKLTLATKENRAAESAARSEVSAAKTALAEKKEALSRLRIETEASARADAAFTQAERAAKTAILEAQIALREKAAALTTAAAAAKAASVAEQALQRDLTTAAAAYRQVGVSATSSGDTQTVANKKVAGSLDAIKGQLEGLRTVATLALGGSLVGSLARDLGQTADAYANLSAKIKITTGEGAAFDTAFKGVFDIAQRTGSAVEDVGSLFTKLSQAAKLSTADTLALVETITQATQLSGASAESSAAAITQFSQAIASGVLRGDELNSVLEQSPRLARALSEGLGVTTGELRKLGEAGALTAAQVIGALQGQSAALQKEFDQLPPTIGRAITSLSNNWTAYVGQVDRATGASATAAVAITALGRNLDTLGALLFSAGKAALAYQAVKLAQSFLETATAARATAAAVVIQTTAVAANTAATAANAAAQGVNTAATAGAAAGAGRFAAAISSIKLFSLVGVITNFREIGTAIGEGVAKLAGYGKAFEEAEIRIKADEAATRANTAAKAALAQQLALAADKALGLSAASKKLVGEFEGLTLKGESVSDSLKKLTKDLELGDLQGITNAGAALDALGLKGKITGQQIRESLVDALKGIDLGVFEIQARAAFDNSEQGARRLKAALDAIADESLKRAGTSLSELETGFSKAASSASNDVDALARTLTDLKITGDEAGRALSTALDKALSAANTERAVQAVIDRFEALGKSGQLAGEQLADGLEKAKAKLDALKPGIQSLDEALKNFGLKTTAELTATADKLTESYKRIAYAAGVSLADQRTAFEVYSKAAIAANGGVESSAVKLNRTILETREAAAGVGKAGADAGRAMAAGFDVATASINATAGSLDALSSAATKARNAASQSKLGGNTYDKNGFAQDTNGNTLTLTGQAKVGDDEYFDKAAYDREVFQTAGSGRPHFVDPQRFVKKKTKSAPTTYVPPSTGSGSGSVPGEPAPGLVNKGGSAGYGGTQTVNLVINGRSTPVSVSSRDDANSLTSVLKQLAAAANRT